jgi:hypothetical protein
MRHVNGGARRRVVDQRGTRVTGGMPFVTLRNREHIVMELNDLVCQRRAVLTFCKRGRGPSRGEAIASVFFCR